MNESPLPHDRNETTEQGNNPFASPRTPAEQQTSKRWWVPNRPLGRPYPPVWHQLVFLVDLLASLVLLLVGGYDLFDRLISPSREILPGLTVNPIRASMIVALLMWSLALVTDALVLMSRLRAWGIGIVTFCVFWLWLVLTVMEWSTGPLPRWRGDPSEILWLVGRVLFNLLWFAALMRYRLWYAREVATQRMPEQE